MDRDHLDAASAFHRMYREFCADCATSCIREPTPEEWVAMLGELVQNSASDSRSGDAK